MGHFLESNRERGGHLPFHCAASWVYKGEVGGLYCTQQRRQCTNKVKGSK